MQKTSKNIISSVKYYACGYCVNKMKFIIKNPPTKEKKFYAGVFLINHKKYGNILYDTGYSESIYKCGVIGKIYNLLNRTYVKEEDTIIAKLKKDNIKPHDINYIILSHLHPDHIGGIKYFPNAKIIISKDCLEEYKKNKIRSLIFKNMIPSDFEKRIQVVDKYNYKYKLFYGFDIFNDNSLILTQIDGHFRGQMGLLIQEHQIFLGADACWGLEFLNRLDEMSIFARFIQNNFKEYKKGFELIKKIKSEGISIYLSHDDCDRKELTE